VVLIVLNLALGIFFLVKDRISPSKRGVTAAKIAPGAEPAALFDTAGAPRDNGRRSEYQLQWFDYTAYENATDSAYAGTVLDDFFNLSELGFTYQPWVQFSEAVYRGKLVNVDVDPMGFPIRRTINRGHVPPGGKVIRVFVFGGSTTFGYNVSDEHTWPSYLSAILNERAVASGEPVAVEITNYGRAYYDTSQETVLLMHVLKSGQRPDLVLFMDGVNWGPDEDVPYFTKKFENAFHRLQFGDSVLDAALSKWRWIPMIRLGYSLKDRFLRARGVPPADPASERVQRDSHHVTHVINRFTQNQALATRICEQYSTQALFFLQPDANYNYPAKLYRLSLPDTFLADRPAREQFYGQMRHAKGVIDLTALFESWGPERKAIVDDVHYSPGFNRFLAQKVADHIDVGPLMEGVATRKAATPTGGPRKPPATGRRNAVEH
jgi:hypothetical protein